MKLKMKKNEDADDKMEWNAVIDVIPVYKDK